jgi:hypothetical protein
VSNFPEPPPLPIDSATWLVEQIVDEASLQGAPLSESDVAMLETPIFELADSDRPAIFALNNRLVPVVRQRIERAKSVGGQKAVRVRPGLRVPADWNFHYSIIFKSEWPWVVSPIMQNVMMKNDWAGERKRWKSR